MTFSERLSNQRRAEIFALSAVLLWSTVATAFKIALRGLSSLELLFYALPASMASLALIITAGKKWKDVWDWHGIKKSLLLGFLNPFLYYVLLFKAYDILPAQLALTLNYTWAIFLVIFSAFILGHRLRIRQAASVLASFAGAAIVITGGSLSTPGGLDFTGIAIALASAVVWALFWISGRKTEGDEAVKLFQCFAAGFIYIAVLMAFTEGFHLPPAKSILPAFYVGIFEMGITFFLWSRAVHLAENTAGIGNLVFISPFLSFFVIAFVLGEGIHLSSVAGLVLIVAGIVCGRNS